MQKQTRIFRLLFFMSSPFRCSIWYQYGKCLEKLNFLKPPFVASDGILHLWQKAREGFQRSILLRWMEHALLRWHSVFFLNSLHFGLFFCTGKIWKYMLKKRVKNCITVKAFNAMMVFFMSSIYFYHLNSVDFTFTVAFYSRPIFLPFHISVAEVALGKNSYFYQTIIIDSKTPQFLLMDKKLTFNPFRLVESRSKITCVFWISQLRKSKVKICFFFPILNLQCGWTHDLRWKFRICLLQRCCHAVVQSLLSFYALFLKNGKRYFAKCKKTKEEKRQLQKQRNKTNI